MQCQLPLKTICLLYLAGFALLLSTTTTVKPRLTDRPIAPVTTAKPARALNATNGTSAPKPAKQPDLIDIVFNLQKENRMLVNDVMSLKQRIAAAVAFFDDRLKVTSSSLDKKILTKSNYLNATLLKHGSRIGSMESDVKEIKLVIAEYVQKILHYHGVN